MQIVFFVKIVKALLYQYTLNIDCQFGKKMYLSKQLLIRFGFDDDPDLISVFCP